MSLSFDVKLGGADSTSNLRGSLKLGSEGVQWQAREGERRVSVKAADVEACEWVRTGRSHFQLRIRHTDNTTSRFDGFDKTDKPKVAEYVSKTFSTQLKDIKLDVQGKNAGAFELEHEHLVFNVDGKRSMDITLADVAKATVNVQKDEIVLEMIQSDGISKKADSLLEMRFYVPNSESVDVDEEGEAPPKSVQLLHDSLSKFVSQENQVDQVTKLEAIKCRIPRATMDVTLYHQQFKLVGPTYDFTVKYKSVTDMFLLPAFNHQNYVVLAVDPPLRKGQTMYQHVIALFQQDDDQVQTKCILPADFDGRFGQFKFKDKVQPVMNMTVEDTFVSLLRLFCSQPGKPMKVLKAGQFKDNADEFPFVKCSVGANTGSLYLLDKCFVFLEKPSIVIMYDDVDSITFDRKQKNAGNSFDLKIKQIPSKDDQRSGKDGKALEFNLIPKKEFERMSAFFEAVSNDVYGGKRMKIANYTDGGDDDMDDLQSDNENLSRANAQGAAMMDEDDDDSSSEDEDFAFDENAGTSSSDEVSSDEGSGGSDADSEKEQKKSKKKEKKQKKHKKDKKKKKHKKDKKAKKENSDDSDGSDDEVASPKKKKAKKEKKDPNRPKQPKSAWLVFCDENRAKVKAETPDISITQISTVLGQKWKELTDEEKKPFEDTAKEYKEEYTKAMAKYFEENPDMVKAKGGKRKAKKEGSDDDSDSDGGKKKKKKRKGKDKDPNAPKGAKSAYMFFSEERRETIKADKPELKATEIFKEIGNLWKDLSAEDKTVYEQKAKDDKDRFRDETEAYNVKRRANSPTLDEFMGDGDASGDGGDSDDDDDEE